MEKLTSNLVQAQALRDALQECVDELEAGRQGLEKVQEALEILRGCSDDHSAVESEDDKSVEKDDSVAA